MGDYWTHFKALDLSEDASSDQIEAVYQRYFIEAKGVRENVPREIDAAYDLLRKPEVREEYRELLLAIAGGVQGIHKVWAAWFESAIPLSEEDRKRFAEEKLKGALPEAKAEAEKALLTLETEYDIHSSQFKKATGIELAEASHRTA